MLIRIVDEAESLATFELIFDGQVKKVDCFLPEDLEESNYIRFLDARATIMEAAEDIAQVAYRIEQGEKVTRKQQAAMESALLTGTKKWVEAVCNLEAGTLDNRRPSLIMKIYNQIEQAMKAKFEPNLSEDEAVPASVEVVTEGKA